MNILITGGSSDIAFAIAKRRIAFGDRIIISCSCEKTLAETTAIYTQQNLQISGIVYNFSHPEASVEAIHANGPIDALILNAFTRVTRFRKLHEANVQQIHEYIMKNIQGNIWLIHHLLPSMLAKNFGRLIFMSSVSAITGTSRYAAYCTAKAALEGLFLNLAVDYSAYNILSNVVRLGLIKTKRTRHFWKNDGYQEKMAGVIPQGCMGEPAQIAEALDPLLSITSMMTGSTMTVSGGLPLLRAEGIFSS